MKSALRRRTPFAKLSWGVVVAAVVAAPLASAPYAAAADGGTTVLSSTFDDGVIAPWFGNGGAALSVVPDPDGTGKSLEATGIDAGYKGPAVDLTKLLTPGVAYAISFEARLADASQPTGSAHFTVDSLSPAASDDKYDWVGGNTALSATAWTTIGGTYTLPAGATKANMYLDSGDSGPYANVLIDNVTITGPASTGGGTTCTPSPAQTLVSADFDDQQLPSTLQKDGGPTLSYENVAGDAATDYSLKVTGRANDYDGVQTVPGELTTLKAGDTVNVSAKVRLATQTAATLSARIVEAPKYDWIGNQSAITDSAWTTISASYQIPAGTDISALKFYIGTGDSGTNALSDGTTTFDYYVDDFSVGIPGVDCGGDGGTGSSCSYPTGDTIISSDFESGDADGWVGRDDGHGTATVAVTDGGHESDKALEASDRTGQGQGIGHDVTCLLQPGATYEFSGWVRFAAGQPADGVWLSLANTAGGSTTYTTLGQFTDVTDSGWAQIDQKFTMPAASDSALLYVETKYYSDGSAGNTSDLLVDDLKVTKPSPLTVEDITPIKDTLPFPVGAAVSDPQITGAPGQLLAKHFDQVTSENAMKVESWYNADHSFKTVNADADALMTFAEDNDLRLYGHTLVWYQQTPDWFFQDDNGDWLTNSPTDQQILRERLDTHIKDVAQYLSKFGAFGSPENPLVSFDVVNEAVSDNVGDPDDLRQSHWYQILGPEYIADAFNDANKYFNGDAADGGFAATGAAHPVTLFYNDFNTEQAGKRGRAVELVKNLIADGVPVDGIGHQFHVTMSTPLSSLKDAIDGFNGITTARGVPLEQAVTELDVPTGTPVTDANKIDQGYYYKGIFDMLRSEYASGAKIFSATVWGLVDSQSWRSSSGAPLLFDAELKAKPAYYGVTDQALPAKQLSAIVFQRVASDKWDQLPLHPIGESGTAGFQLRWQPDSLIAYVSSTDATADAADQATLTWGDGTQTATVKRDGTVTGTGVTALVSSTATGWTAAVTLPTGALTTASTPKFDVTVTDGAQTVSWNTPGSLGTLQLVEPLSFTIIPEASVAPVIDGAKDDAWAQASSVVTSKKISGSADGAKATVYQLWKDDYLYVLADVTDPTIDTSSGNAYEQDSVEIFTDLGNAKNGSYRADDAQMRISAAGAVSFGAGDSEAVQQARLTSATSRTATGYRVEARIDLKDTTGVGKFEGLDFEVNDGTAGARTANFGWAEQTGSAYQTTSRWGVAELTGTAGGGSNPGDGGSNPGDGGSNPGDGGSNPGDGGSTGGSGSGSGSTGGSGPSAPTLGDTPTVKVDGRAVAGGKLLVSGTGFTPGELVSIVLHSTPVTLGVVSAGSSGAVAQTVTIPANIDPGAHHIELTGLTSGVVVSVPLTVYASAAADPGSLPVTGTDVTTWLLLALTLLVAGGLLLVRRRATHN